MTSPVEDTKDVETHFTEAKEVFDGSQSTYAEDLSYYEASERDTAIGVAVPNELRTLLAQMGIPRIYVNSLADRLQMEGFRLAGAEGSDEELWNWWQANNLDVESRLGHIEAFIYGRAYVTVAAPDPEDPLADPEVPIIRVESPTALHAEIDPRTRRVTRALRVIKDDEDNEIAATLYLPNQTVIFNNGEAGWAHDSPIAHNLGVVPVIPLANRGRLSDLIGTTEITPEIRSVTDAMARLVMNLQVASELLAVPQRILFGVAQDALQADPGDRHAVLETYMASMIAIENPEGKAQQFAAAELRNFVDGMSALLKLAAAYTGLPPQYLSTATDNPASAEAIKSSESRLVRNAEGKTLVFGDAWEEVARVALLVMKGKIPAEAFRLESLWRDPSTPTYQAKADGVMKLYAGGQGIIPVQQARIDMGYSDAARRQMELWDEQTPMARVMGMYDDKQNTELAAETGDEPPADDKNSEEKIE
ncbi:portal protein [Rhodococcus phage BobbyDazzler]|uniref:Portal protein n=1 Tax=Rhodococcus phage Hiro TaxID=2015828 RepID=A0A222ZHH7_9CAUD|nr:portal protein [Rhodococcus phage Hiro]AOZ62765.1 portal protein [Rhodococcus phage Yogi]AQP30936.1 portal protein [Rhodococcus phage BobbyDazzler]ASR77047.1 portal protein [Rhodococcus phage Bonanza]ASR80788.1 portal protein [Rhodococcus phage Yoncess]AWY04395.1 portal protein [Rhodococcus phage Alpacados]AWY04610.1 portal protein [Rhodococcus phage Bryce]AWY05948.1 portal protein [Rhodococcus phage Rasputin]